MNKAIITVVGQDTVGIIARVCTYLSQHNVNVLDISQTILGDDIGVRIRCQREEIFTKMHRI